MSCCSDKMEPVKADSCCTPRDTALQASITMRKTGCGCSPVVKSALNVGWLTVIPQRLSQAYRLLGDRGANTHIRNHLAW